MSHTGTSDIYVKVAFRNSVGVTLKTRLKYVKCVKKKTKRKKSSLTIMLVSTGLCFRLFM